MAVSPLLPIGNLPVVEDSYVKGGYHTVADVTARDAIPTERRRAGMLAWVESPPSVYRLGAGLGNGDWETFVVPATPADVYLSSAGNDGNSGQSIGSPVATWARAWEVVAGTSTVTVHLIGTVAGYEVPPAAVRWLTITGDDNFTVVATGVAGAATDANSFELASATTEDAYRHFTVEFTDGAAAGYRRTIRDNSTTIVTPVHQFENFTGTTVPAPGDTYRILRPSAKIVGSAIVSGANYRQFALNEALVPVRVDLVNVAIEPDNPGSNIFFNFILTAAGGAWFGVLIEGEWMVDGAAGDLFSGADDLNTTADSYSLIVEKLGVSGYVPGQWHGWGLGFANSTFTGAAGTLGGLINGGTGTVKNQGFFYGFVTCGRMQHGWAELLGGSAQLIILEQARMVFAIANLARNFSILTTRFLVKTASTQAMIMRSGTQMYWRYSYSSQNVALEIRATGAGNATVGYIGMSRGAQGHTETGFEISYAGASGGFAVSAASGASFSYGADGFGGLPPWSMGTTGGIARASSGGQVTLASFSMTGGKGVVNDGGSVTCQQVGGTVPTAVVTGQVWLQTAGIGLLENTLSFTGDNAALVDVKGGSFTQVSGTATITNNATGANDVLRVSGGAQANLLGGASTVLNGSAGASGFAINARGGGRVFTAAQPSSCTGVTADLTVGVGGGEDQPDTFLSTSFSSLVSGDTLSAIARST